MLFPQRCDTIQNFICISAVQLVPLTAPISLLPPGHIRSAYHNRKGFLSQNALFVTDFNLKSIYMLTGWEGSASDARVYNNATSTDLRIPARKYLLTDAGYVQGMQLLVPY